MVRALDIAKLLDWVTANVYDPGHGLLGEVTFVVDAEGLLDHLREQLEFSKGKMTEAFDQARVRVHGKDVNNG